MILLGKMMSSWLFSCLYWYSCAHQTLRDSKSSCCNQWQKDRVIMAQNVLVVSPRLNNTLTLGYPVAYGERDLRGQLVVAWSGELEPNLGCPTRSCCPEMAAEGCSQARQRCKRTCLHLAPSSPEQEPLWAGLWTGAGRGARLHTLPEQLFPISSGGKELWARQKPPPAAWVWPTDSSWSLPS